MDIIKHDPGGSRAARKTKGEGAASLPALTPQAGILDGSDGTVRMAWARYKMPMANWGPYGSAYVSTGGHTAKDAAIASSVATDLQLSNPVIATVLDTLEVLTAGTGLTLSSKPDLARYGVSPEDIQQLSHDIETLWAAFAANAREVDFTGRFDLHSLANAAFRHYLLNGEYVATLDFARFPGCTTYTKVSLLDPEQLDRTKTVHQDGVRAINGVGFDEAGRLAGYWLRRIPLGNTVGYPLSVFVPAYTAWGRPKVVHGFQFRDARQVRGISPIAAALTPAQERETLSEFTVATAFLQTMYALTVETDLPPALAFQSLGINDAEGGMKNYVAGMGDWYNSAKVNPQPGVVNHLYPGNKLKMNRAETPNSTFQPFDNSLVRKAAKASGASYEDVSGDFSKTSFSASRWASELPWRLVLKRRREIIEPLYRAVFRCWLEEKIETGVIRLPRNAPAFWQDPEAFTNAKWLGSGRMEPDRAKAAKAAETELRLGLTTLTDELAAKGIDFETHLEALKTEISAYKALGLQHPATLVPSGSTSTLEIVTNG